MSARSTAWYVPYDVRPAKQIERRLVLECLQAARAASIAVEKYPFIGMGGFRFIDFLLAHKILGVNDFTSIEHDKKLVPRCEFNRPFDSIPVFEGAVADYIAQKGLPVPATIWLDYEWSLSLDLKSDLLSLASALKPESFLIVTLSGEVPKRLLKLTAQERLAKLLEEFGEFAEDLKVEDVAEKAFHKVTARLVGRFLAFGFNGRADGFFWPFIRVAYKDSTQMITVGGFFGSPQSIRRLKPCIRNACGFLRVNDAEFIYGVRQFNLTDAERRLFDRAAFATHRRRKERAQLRKLGFEDALLTQYRQLIRYIPRYFEPLI